MNLDGGIGGPGSGGTAAGDGGHHRLHADALRVLRGWDAPDSEQAGLCRGFADHLAARADGMWRTCRPSHITAAALVVDPAAGRVLLTLHARIGLWLQTGGHCEPGDTTLAGTALREATEESGIPGLELLPGGPVRLDRHPVVCAGEAAEHLDVQYVALAPPGATPVISDESVDLRWFPFGALPDGTDDAVRALAERARVLV